MKTTDYSRLVLDSLKEHGIIDNELYEKCSKPHIADLPYDNRTTDPSKLAERQQSIEEKIKEKEADIQSLQKENEKIEKDIYNLNKDIEKSDNQLDDYNDEIESRLTDATDTLETVQNDILNEYGTEQDSRYEWGNKGIGEEFDYIRQEINRIYRDIDNVWSELFFDTEDGKIPSNIDSLSKLHNPSLNASRRDIEDLRNYMETAMDNTLDEIPDGLIGGIPSMRNIYDNLFETQDVFGYYDDERNNNNKLVSNRDSLQDIVDKNNEEIHKIDKVLQDYKDELSKISL